MAFFKDFVTYFKCIYNGNFFPELYTHKKCVSLITHKLVRHKNEEVMTFYFPHFFKILELVMANMANP